MFDSEFDCLVVIEAYIASLRAVSRTTINEMGVTN